MRASPGLSSGFGASSYTSCSGPPRLRNRMAFIVISPPLVFSSCEPSRRKVSARFAAPVEIAHDLRALDHVLARQACDVRVGPADVPQLNDRRALPLRAQ